MQVAGFIQARMASQRLPGKVLAELGGEPLLAHVVRRARAALGLNRVVVLTGLDPTDDAIEFLCRRLGVACFRGSDADVLDRFYRATLEDRPDAVCRLTADCPLLDPLVIQRVIETFQASGADYASNAAPPTFPDGLDVEVFRTDALAHAWREARLPSEREHVTPFIRNHTELFTSVNVTHTSDLSSLRWTVDEPADLEMVGRLIGRLDSPLAGLDEILSALKDDESREITSLNSRIARNEGYARSLSEDGQAPTRGAGQRLYQTARKRIPGGTQLLSKRPEMFLPENWPAYYSRAAGCEVWDLDGRRYLDFSISGIGACLLGYADPDVNAAVIQAVRHGSASTLNCPEEVELAHRLCEIHPWAEMARFTRSGGESMAVAVRIARAATGRDIVAFCGYHGWSDWYLAANLAEEGALDGHLLKGLAPRGVPRGLQGTAVPFRYNEPAELEAIVAEYGDRLAAIITEPIRSVSPTPEFLDALQSARVRTGAALVLDEITMGFRLTLGGAHRLYGLEPDIAVLAKAMSNGHPMGAIIGREATMKAAQDTFISSTSWTERVGPAAALATIHKLREQDVAKQLGATGQRIKEGWRSAAEKSGLPIDIGGVDPLPNFSIRCADPQAVRTLYTQEMLDRGFLAIPAVYVTAAHRPELVESYLSAAASAFEVIAHALDHGGVLARLRGPVAHKGFERLT